MARNAVAGRRFQADSGRVRAGREGGVRLHKNTGDTFVDRGDETVHIARNESQTANVEFWATYLVPGAPGTALRIDAADPGPPGACDDDDDEDDDD